MFYNNYHVILIWMVIKWETDTNMQVNVLPYQVYIEHDMKSYPFVLKLPGHPRTQKPTQNTTSPFKNVTNRQDIH